MQRILTAVLRPLSPPLLVGPPLVGLLLALLLLGGCGLKGDLVLPEQAQEPETAEGNPDGEDERENDRE